MERDHGEARACRREDGVIPRLLRPGPARLTLLLLVVALAGLPVLFALARYSRASDTACLRCHLTRPGIGWGQQDPWHGGVGCVECHARHDELLPIDYRAHPEEMDTSCLRCHGEVAEWTDCSGASENPEKVRYSHKTHREEYGTSCSTCHREMFHNEVPRKSWRPSKQGCIQDCHEDADSLAGCELCHEPDVVTPPTEEEATRGACVRCHWTLDTHIGEQYGRSFRHWLHADLDCATCHPRAKQHGRLAPRTTCQSCHHRDLKGVDCESCHRVEDNWRKGLSGGSIKAEPEEMVGLADCGDCHPDVSRGSLVSERSEMLRACEECHREDDPPRDMQAFMDGWQAQDRQAFELLGASRRISSTQDRPSAGLGLDEILRRDLSCGVHNPGLTRAVLELARELGEIPALEDEAWDQQVKEETP